MDEVKEAIKIAVDAGFRVEHDEGPNEGLSIFKCSGGYMIQRPDRGCYESKSFDGCYDIFNGYK